MQGKILLVEHHVTERILIKAHLSEAFYDVTVTDSGAEALTRLHDAPDAILLAADLPGTDCERLCAAFRAATDPVHVPILVLTSDADIPRARVLGAGADEIIDRKAPADEMLARLRGCLRQGNADLDWYVPTTESEPGANLGFADAQAGFSHPERLVLLTDRSDCAEHLLETLKVRLPFLLSSQDMSGALGRLGDADGSDIIVLAASSRTSMPKVLTLLADLAVRPATRDRTKIVLLPLDARDLVAESIDRGADDVIQMPAEPQEIALRISRQAARKADRNRARDALRDGLRASVRDPLTGLHNRRFAMPRLARIVETALKEGHSFAVLMADIDHFKRINDRFGHSCGDAVLVEVARRLRAPLRAQDLIARVGGEEFLIVLPKVSARRAERLARLLCRRIAAQPVATSDSGAPIHVTLSIGVSTARIIPGGLDIETLIGAADRALYASKAAGRNTVTLRELAA